MLRQRHVPVSGLCPVIDILAGRAAARPAAGGHRRHRVPRGRMRSACRNPVCAGDFIRAGGGMTSASPRFALPSPGRDGNGCGEAVVAA